MMRPRLWSPKASFRCRPGANKVHAVDKRLVQVTRTLGPSGWNESSDYFHYDSQGSVIAMTDATGNTTGEFTYGLYGEPEQQLSRALRDTPRTWETGSLPLSERPLGQHTPSIATITFRARSTSDLENAHDFFTLLTGRFLLPCWRFLVGAGLLSSPHTNNSITSVLAPHPSRVSMLHRSVLAIVAFAACTKSTPPPTGGGGREAVASVKPAGGDALNLRLGAGPDGYTVVLTMENVSDAPIWLNMRMRLGSAEAADREIWFDVMDLDSDSAIPYHCRGRSRGLMEADYHELPQGASYTVVAPIHCQAPERRARLQVTAHYQDNHWREFSTAWAMPVFSRGLTSNTIVLDYRPPAGLIRAK